MSNKNLLNENTVRRFMKLAEIEPLTNQFVDKINEVKHSDNKKDGKVDEAAHDMKDDVKEAMGDYTDDEAGKRDPVMEEELDETIDEELDALLAEMELDEVEYQDDDPEMDAEEEEDPEMDAEEEDLEMDMEEPMDAAPAMGGMDPEELAALIKDAVMDALKQLVDDGDLDISMDEPEEVGVEEEEEDMDMVADTMEEEMINEVAQRVIKRIARSRRG